MSGPQAETDLLLEYPHRGLSDQEEQTYVETTACEIHHDPACTICQKTPPGFFERYRGFLLSPGALITAGNALLLALGFVAQIVGATGAAKWLYLASALIGGAPIFKLAAVNIVTRFDLTAGVMVSIAMIAALVIGEYSAAALVAFMMLVGEMLENFTIARADHALNELESLVPQTVTLRSGRAARRPRAGAPRGADPCRRSCAGWKRDRRPVFDHRRIDPR
jgi:hypothetical protein